MPFDRDAMSYQRQRSPYGIKEPGAPPAPQPWYMRTWALLSQKNAQLLARYQLTNTSGQIPAAPGRWEQTRQQATWHRPTQPHADPITGIRQRPQFGPGWPDTPGGGYAPSVPSDRAYRMDARPQLLGRRRRAYLPGNFIVPYTPEPLSLWKRRNVPLGHRYRQDFLPVRVDDTAPTLTYAEPAGRVSSVITRPRRFGLSLMAGPLQYGTRQTFGQWGDSLVLAPPVWSRTNQGVRSIGGKMWRNQQGTGRTRIPAVFTPTSVQ